jgi:hypothetical protein
MQDVTLSHLTRTHAPYRFLCPIRSRRQLIAFGIFLVFGLPLITLLLKLLDPTAPLACILVPALVGGSLPMFAVLPARLNMVTRFHAGHLIHMLDETIQSLGYARSETLPAGARYHAMQPRWLAWKENDIAVTVRDHSIEVSGPLCAMRALQEKLAR